MGGSTSVEGFRVVHALPGSPLEEAGLQPYTDFVVSANGIRLASDGTFGVIVAKSVNCRVFLKVFNILTKELREAVVTPRDEWGGSGLLGGAVRFEEWSSDDEFGIRVVGVLPNSIAQQLGLAPGSDFIVGTDEVSVVNIDQLAAQTMKRESLFLDVFSAATKQVRRLAVSLPGEQKSLGLDLGQGYVHSLNKQLAATAETPAVAAKPEEVKVEAAAEAPKVTFLKPKEEEKPLPPPPKLQTVKHTESEVAPVAKVYRVLGPPNIYERDNDPSAAFLINVLKSPYVRPAES